MDFLALLGPAFAAGLIIAITHASLGLEVLKRGIIFLDLAIAQIAALGVIGVHLLEPHPSELNLQFAALFCGLAAAFTFRFLEKRVGAELEAIIGSSYVIAASSGLLLTLYHPHGAEHLKSILSGQLLFVSWSQFFSHLPVYLAVLFLWYQTTQSFREKWFHILFAVAITSSVQLVGVYLVFSSLILPALAVHREKKHQKIRCILIGSMGMAAGIGCSILWDLPAGPMAVLFQGGLCLLVRLTRYWLPGEGHAEPFST